MSETTIRMLEQGRAKYAYDCAKKGSKKSDYTQYVKKIPMLIKTNGLGSTFSFMFSKGKTYEFIGTQILDWLKKEENGIFPKAKDVSSFKDLNEKVVSLNSQEYRALTIEVLAFLNWLRRFAEGFTKEEDDDTN